ncbi:RES domain protein [Vibrio aerogenes CECT 7868]|uniref:RES domain protein n=1 Tax=Vibrio aerogenes CECT 7868 TaxID=1216006 RepID=A0A1M5ZNL9_9VIBR|nr:RES family NAD+ phosphorylase [Vibrio aerogenes]SHI25719.1 RES domain protein [Vibrio aerogenes CECT 7868]
MELFRLSHTDYVDLSGRGGLYGAGRWHEKGSLICYTASSRSLCVLERLVHESMADMPSLMMMTIWIPDDVSVLRRSVQQLPAGWDAMPENGTARAVGQAFLEENQALLLQVPSVIVRDEFNYMINPQHPDSGKIQIVETSPYYYDSRLQTMMR